MTINVAEIETMPMELKAELLKELVQDSFLWWYKDTMRTLEVPQRTRHYKAFSWSQRQWSTEFGDREDRKLMACTQILNSTTISEWLNAYLIEWSVRSFVDKLHKVLGRTDIPVTITVN